MSSFLQLDIILKKQTNGKVLLRYLADSTDFHFEDRVLDLADIKAQTKEAEMHYYAYRPSNLVQTGQALYQWLDGADGFLERAIEEFPADQLLVLAFQGEPELLHLPWELLHNGKEYMVQRTGHEMVPVRLAPKKATLRKPKKKALEMVFMATSPRDVQPELNFEAEEVRILEATEKLPVNLEVEESGNLKELHLLLNQMGEKKVDVVHISGHAANQAEPHFLTEDAQGYLQKATAADFKQCFNNHKPSLLFLSGCETGGATDQGGVPSLAGDLIQSNFPAILAWAKPVKDITATEAASEIYRVLSEGQSIPKAFHTAMNALLNDPNQRFTDWHLLRLYAFGHVPVNLIQPGRYRKRAQTTEKQFLDSNQKVRVPGRRAFVGRRRVIQDCLRVLRDPNAAHVGIVLHGTGGLGKSSIASRLCQRLDYFYESKVHYGVLDELVLLQKLGFDQTQAIEQLKDRFSSVFENRTSDKRFLIVLDDFEQNFEQINGQPKDFGNGEFRLTPEAVRVLESLLQAIGTYDADDQAPQLLITSRYTFQLEGTANSPGTSVLKFMQLNSFEPGAWDRFKKRQKTKGFDPALVAQCEQVADGNPRLLEWLLEILGKSKGLDPKELLKQLEAKEEKFRENLLAQYLLDRQDKKTRQLIASLALFEVPVPALVLEKITGITDAESRFQKAAGISLVETYAEVFGSAKAHYRLAAVFKSLMDAPTKAQYHEAASSLAPVWEEITAEAQLEELCRLALLGSNEEVLVAKGVKYVAYLYKVQRFREAAQWGKNMLAILPENAKLLLHTGRALEVLGRMDKAKECYEKGKKFTSDERLSSALIHNMAGILVHQEDIPSALKLYEESLAINERLGDQQGKSATLHQMAGILVHQGDIPSALKLYEESLAIKERLGDQKGKSATLHAMAGILVHQGDIPSALKLYEESLAIKERLGDQKGKSATLHNMAGILVHQEDIPSALKLYEESLAINERLGDQKGKSATLHAMAGILVDQGDIPSALKLYEESLAIKERLGDQKGKSATLHNMAGILVHQGDIPSALKLYEESLVIKESLGYQQGTAATLVMMAQLLALKKKEYRRSWEMVNGANAILQHIGSRDLEQAQEIAMHILQAWIVDQVGEEGLKTFNEKAGKDAKEAHDWLKEQGIDTSLEQDAGD